VYFQATKESPLEEHIYSVNLSTGDIFKITSEKGVHNVLFNSNKEYLIDIYSNIQTPTRGLLLSSGGENKQTLFENTNLLKDYKLGKTSVFTIKSNDNTDLYCRMITPPDFDENKKYPALVYVYGGPHAQLVKNSWLAASDLFLQYMALKGYVVFTLDNRGSYNRGLKFEQAIFRNLGTVEVDDQMKGIDFLTSKKWIDSKRIGVHGWSYGGFMTISLMLKHPGIFKAGVAGGPVIDWKYYEVMYGERYMDTPEENPEGYKNASLLNYVDSLKGKLLVIHGTMDNTVVWQHSLTFIKECINKGVQVDYFVYPDHEHNIGGKDRVHLYKKIFQYFEENL